MERCSRESHRIPVATSCYVHMSVVIFREEVRAGRCEPFFTGTPETLIARWCVWYYENLEDEAADVDYETTQLQKIIEGSIE
jgi:hypothetical protein